MKEGREGEREGMKIPAAVFFCISLPEGKKEVFFS
jgi:hypothetical protein